MRVIQGTRATDARVVALGTFDGVHLAHMELLKAGSRMARELGVPLQVCTFDRHPLRVIRPESAPGLLTTTAEKLARIQAAGAEETRLLHFTRRMADAAPETFLQSLREMSAVRGIVVGWNYTFGREGRGNAELLVRDAARNGYRAVILHPVKTPDGKIISSSEIRKALAKGCLPEAEKLLGAPYRLCGPVTAGKHLGHELGFPTANVAVSPDKLLPAYGVYVCLAETRGDVYRGIVNIGTQPTLPSGRVTVEVHLLDSAPELYGEPLRVTLLEFLRAERRFPSTEALRRQIAEDRETAWRRWSEIGQSRGLSDLGSK